MPDPLQLEEEGGNTQPQAPQLIRFHNDRGPQGLRAMEALMSMTYFPLTSTPENIPAIRQALLALGCTPGQVAMFSNRKYSALPKWLRVKIKASLRQPQAEPRKLCPAAGELAFYVEPTRFPRMKNPCDAPAPVVAGRATVRRGSAAPQVKTNNTQAAAPRKPRTDDKRKWFSRRKRKHEGTATAKHQPIAA